MAKKSKKNQMNAIASPERMYPEIHVTSKDLPEIKDWKVGKKYNLMVEAEQVGLHKDMYGDNKNEVSARFRITSIKPVGDKKTARY